MRDFLILFAIVGVIRLPIDILFPEFVDALIWWQRVALWIFVGLLAYGIWYPIHTYLEKR